MPFSYNLAYVDFKTGTTSRGYYCRENDLEYTTMSRFLLGMKEADLLLVQRIEPEAADEPQRCMDRMRRKGFIWELSIAGFAVPAVWDSSFSFDGGSLPLHRMPAGNLDMDWRVRWPEPVLEEVRGFRCYPFEDGLIWAPMDGARVWVEPMPEHSITPTTIAVIEVLHQQPEFLHQLFMEQYGARGWWRVNAAWAAHSPVSLPDRLTLTTAIRLAIREAEAA